MSHEVARYHVGETVAEGADGHSAQGNHLLRQLVGWFATHHTPARLGVATGQTV